jgi:hypothetical protein
MADRKISDLTALTTPASGDYLPIVDISEVAAASKNKRITIEELMRGAPDGTAAAPSIAFESDPNTGIYSTGADQVAISTNGTGRLFVDASGRIGVNNPSPTTDLDILSASTAQISVTTTEATGASLAGLTLNQQGAGASSFIVRAGGNYTILGSTTNTPVLFASNNLERMRITGAGLLGLGTSSPWNNQTIFGQGTAGNLTTARQFGVGAASTYQLAVGYYQTGEAAPFAGVLQALDNGNGTYLLLNPSAGNVGIGTTSPGYALDVQIATSSANTGARIYNSTAGTGNSASLSFSIANSFSSTNQHAAIQAISEVSTNTLTSLAFLTSGGSNAGNATERLRIDSSGRLLVGTSTGTNNIRLGQKIASVSTGGTDYGGLSLTTYAGATNAVRPVLDFQRSRGTTDGSLTAVASGDFLGTIVFRGSDGTNFIDGAYISGEIDGGVSTADLPTRLVFSTTADGAASPTERLRITSAGVLQVADAGNITVGTTTGTKIGTATTQKLGFYNATPVVQPTAVADATDAATVITQLNDLLAKLRTLGIIAT